MLAIRAPVTFTPIPGCRSSSANAALRSSRNAPGTEGLFSRHHASALSISAAALAEMQAAYTAGQEALKSGDFTAYDQAQKRLDAALKKAAALAPQLNPDGAGATPSPSPSPTG